MNLSSEQMPPDGTSLSLEQQVVRLQALLEASRLVHSTIDLPHVLQQAARIVVLELEMEGAVFTEPHIAFGDIPADALAPGGAQLPRFPLLGRDGAFICELVVIPPGGRELTLYENDFLEGLVLQTAVAAENAANHERHLEYARVAQDLDAARAIQRSLLPQTMPAIPGYSLAARSDACYQVGGDYLDVVTEPDGSHLIVVADVAGKGLASALVCTTFRSAFRALARQCLPLANSPAASPSSTGTRARRPAAATSPPSSSVSTPPSANSSSSTPVTTPPSSSSPKIPPRGPSRPAAPLSACSPAPSTPRTHPFPPGARLLLYTDGLTEVFQGRGRVRYRPPHRCLSATSDTRPDRRRHPRPACGARLTASPGSAPQQDDMSAIALCRLTSSNQEKA